LKTIKEIFDDFPRFDYFQKILKESVIIVILSSLMGMISGTVLSINEEILYSIPVILLLLPSLNSLIGDISTVLISRLTTQLYIGIIPPKVTKSESLKDNFIGLLITTLLGLGALLGIGYGTAVLTSVPIINPLFMILILLITMLILFCIMFVILFISSVYLFKKGKDPNNYLIPAITSLLDFLNPFFIILFITIFL
jgi:mgtE-like transporter